MIKLVAVAVGCAAFAHTSNQWLELWLQPPPVFDETARHAPPQRADTVATLPRDSLSKLTSLPLTAPTPSTETSSPRALPPHPELLGTLLSADEWSFASVRDDGRVRSVHAGDSLFGSTVKDIERRRLVLADGSEVIPIGAGGALSPVASPLKNWAADPARLTKELGTVRAMPAFKDGKPNGLRLSGIAADSLLARLGAQNGDVVLTANGHQLHSLDGLIPLMAELTLRPSATVVIERNGQRLEMNVALPSSL